MVHERMGTSAVQSPFRQRNRIVFLWLLAAVVVTAMILGRPTLKETSPLHDLLEICGLLLVLGGVFGRLWSILYIGNKKNTVLVTSGPYSMTRNPLYFFSMIAVIGAGLIYGSLTLLAVLGIGSFMAFHYAAKREEHYLRSLFGERYRIYAETVPMFWPDLRLCRSEKEVTFSTPVLAKTFRDALFLVLIYPALQMLEYLHLNEVVVALFRLP